MKFSHSLSALAIMAIVEAATIPSAPWTTLTPKATQPASASALKDFDGSFALSIKTLSSASAATTAAASSSKGKRAVQQISDGQVQDQTTKTAAVVNQITDGQVQQQTKTTAAVVNQITDGQVQQQPKATKASVVNQIGDGQIQQQTKAPAATASVVNQISDGQIQQKSTVKATATGVVSQIGDGQVQQTKTTASGQATQISDGQVQATGSAQGSSAVLETCVDNDALTVTLKNGELRDSKGRIGAIVANRQFQFDGPPPQAGTIYAGGWTVVPNGEKGGYKLALGDSSVFYKCLSGDFYNLYDQSIGSQCSPIEIDILKAVKC